MRTVRMLPESLVLLRSRGRTAEAQRWVQRLGLDPELATAPVTEPEPAGRGRFALLFSARYRTLTLLFSVATFLSLLVLFGIYTWLPQLMRSAGYEVGSALTFLVVLGIGTAVGPLVIGRVADRIGSRPTIVASFLLAVVGISLLSQPLPGWLLYGAVVLAGVGTVGTQILLNMFIASRYPVHVRATAIGFALSAGRIGAAHGGGRCGHIAGAQTGGVGAEGCSSYGQEPVVAAQRVDPVRAPHVCRKSSRACAGAT